MRYLISSHAATMRHVIPSHSPAMQCVMWCVMWCVVSSTYDYYYFTLLYESTSTHRPHPRNGNLSMAHSPPIAKAHTASSILKMLNTPLPMIRHHLCRARTRARTRACHWANLGRPLGLTGKRHGRCMRASQHLKPDRHFSHVFLRLIFGSMSTRRFRCCNHCIHLL